MLFKRIILLTILSLSSRNVYCLDFSFFHKKKTVPVKENLTEAVPAETPSKLKENDSSFCESLKDTPRDPEVLTGHWNVFQDNGLKGEKISSSQYTVSESAYDLERPLTVSGAMAETRRFPGSQQMLPDPFVGKNFRKWPGMSDYPEGTIFTKKPMSDSNPFSKPWWYRKEFEVSDLQKDSSGRYWLDFGGINFRSDLYLNGKKIADKKDFAGPFRSHRFDVTEHMSSGNNVLALKTYSETPNDLGMSWLDWAPSPPDKMMGIFKDVRLQKSGPVKVQSLRVETKELSSDYSRAQLALKTTLHNSDSKPKEVKLKVSYQGQDFIVNKTLKPGENNIELNAKDIAALSVKNPKLWWPAGMGDQHQESLKMIVLSNNEESDVRELSFGIRSTSSEIDSSNNRQFYVNGKKFFVKGGGWTPDLFLRPNSARDCQTLLNARNMGLNTVRLEGFLQDDKFYEMADKLGLMVIAGWPCCTKWEEQKKWTPEDKSLALKSLQDQIEKLSSHPSLLLWLNGSDKGPPPELAAEYAQIHRSLGNHLHLAAASDVDSAIHSAQSDLTGNRNGKVAKTERTRVKMDGPYEWVPPLFASSGLPGSVGFNTETGLGISFPPASIYSKWNPDQSPEVDAYHAGAKVFGGTKNYEEAVNSRYGAVAEKDDFIEQAQWNDFENHRAFFEAFQRNFGKSTTGHVHWMLNNPWPSLRWNTFATDGNLTASSYAIKKANEPESLHYDYGSGSIVYLNDPQTKAQAKQARVRILDKNMKVINEQNISLPASQSVRSQNLMNLNVEDIKSKLPKDSKLYFVDMALLDDQQKTLNNNFYWLSTQMDTLPKSYGGADSWYRVPVKQYADLKEFSKTPSVLPELNVETLADGTFDILLQNNNDTKASLFNDIAVLDSKGNRIPGALLSENYVSILPGEKRRLRLSLPASIRPSSIVVTTKGKEQRTFNL